MTDCKNKDVVFYWSFYAASRQKKKAYFFFRAGAEMRMASSQLLNFSKQPNLSQIELKVNKVYKLSEKQNWNVL